MRTIFEMQIAKKVVFLFFYPDAARCELMLLCTPTFFFRQTASYMQYHLQLSTVALVSVTLQLITSQSLSLHSTLFYGGMFLSHTSRQLLFLIIKMI